MSQLRRDTVFNITLQNLRLETAADAAFNAAKGANLREANGMVLAQVFRLADGKLRIKGVFVEADDAAKIQTILSGTDEADSK